MSNICSLSMDNTHNNVEFGVLQKTSKQSLISIFLLNREGGGHPLPPPIPTPRSGLRPSNKGFALAYTKTGPPHPQFPRSAPILQHVQIWRDSEHPFPIYKMATLSKWLQVENDINNNLADAPCGLSGGRSSPELVY